MVMVHVDDFVISGDGPEYQTAFEKLKQASTWGGWEQNEYGQCGVWVKHHLDSAGRTVSVSMAQTRYSLELETRRIPRDRRREPRTPLTEQEKSSSITSSCVLPRHEDEDD